MMVWSCCSRCQPAVCQRWCAQLLRCKMHVQVVDSEQHHLWTDHLCSELSQFFNFQKWCQNNTETPHWWLKCSDPALWVNFQFGSKLTHPVHQNQTNIKCKMTAAIFVLRFLLSTYWVKQVQRGSLKQMTYLQRTTRCHCSVWFKAPKLWFGFPAQSDEASWSFSCPTVVKPVTQNQSGLCRLLSSRPWPRQVQARYLPPGQARTSPTDYFDFISMCCLICR